FSHPPAAIVAGAGRRPAAVLGVLQLRAAPSEPWRRESGDSSRHVFRQGWGVTTVLVLDTGHYVRLPYVGRQQYIRKDDGRLRVSPRRALDLGRTRRARAPGRCALPV